ncbi:hypothetical protein GCM10018785_73890 [Streptomyces longispororuber]|uniref:Uncharacterized protein n=1 Tax=Streptomyces longispororuber TaxID=68230 RepID=A0A919ADI5_9ACTN|nr:hypothetical protein [Streptomyces longispororuber]GHE99505.1 hypothetical protein GCM10018785_73890 [Streptomyces longispororuber]
MAVLAVFIPVLLLGVVLALGRYEELLLPPAELGDDTFEPFAGDGARRAL